MWCFGRYFFSACLGLSALVFPLMVWCGGPNGFFFDGRWIEFACGVAVYYRVQCAEPGSRLARWRIIEVCLFLLAAGYFFVWKAHKDQISEEMFVSGGFALLAILLFKYDRRIFAGRAWRWIWSLCAFQTKK